MKKHLWAGRFFKGLFSAILTAALLFSTVMPAFAQDQPPSPQSDAQSAQTGETEEPPEQRDDPGSANPEPEPAPQPPSTDAGSETEELAELVPEAAAAEAPEPFTLEPPGAPGGAAGSVISYQAFNDGTSLTNFTDLLGGGRTLTLGTGQTAHAQGSSGDALFFYGSQERSVRNGVVAVDISTGSSYRCGVMFRSADANNYSWAGFDNAGTLRIREKSGGQESDILLSGLNIPNQFTLRVEYWQDNLKVFVGSEKLYDGVRPLVSKFAASANGTVSGRCGLMGWSVFSADFDNLYVCEYAPTVTNVTAAALEEAVIEGTDISLGFTAGTDLSAVTLEFVTDPQGAAAIPAGAQDLSGGALEYTLTLEAGGSRVYHITASHLPAGSYLNPFNGSGSQALLDSLQDIHADASGIKMAHSDGRVYSTTSVRSGNHLWMDTNSPIAENGILSVDYDELAGQWRTGLLLRAQDAQNYTWVGIQAGDSLRIREAISGVEKDIQQTVALPGRQFKLKAAYYGDELLVYAGETLLYQGLRPHKKENTSQPAGVGRIGMMGWDHTDTAFDNLRYEPFVPLVTGAGAEASIQGNTVTLTEPDGTDLSTYTPWLTVFPSSAEVSPAGPQDFSTPQAQQEGILYTVTAGSATAQYRVKVTTAASQLAVLENSEVRVELNKLFPTVYTYRLKSSNAMFGGALLTQNTIKINGASYTPANVSYTPDPANGAARYRVELTGVSLGSAARNIAFDVRYVLAGPDLSMSIENVTGEPENQRLQIALDAPVITLEGSEPGAVIAYGGVNGNGGSGVKTISGGTLNSSSVSWPFLACDRAAAAVYTENQWNRPYTVKIAGGNGEIWSDGDYHRLAEGLRPVKDGAAGQPEEIVYRQTVHLCGDENGDGAVNWQDAALWTRTQIPQMPKNVRDFFNGGGWAQTHAAFPGNGQAGYVGNYKGFTTLYSTIGQLVEVQRQIYNLTDGMGKFTMEVVGWNGRGHDYGWPNINEVTFNPALGTEAEFRAAQTAIKQYQGDLSFHTNMSDITDNSESYLRGTAESMFGNRASNTGQTSYGSNVFGWNAWFLSHFKDLPYALNRQDAFIGEGGRFLAPQFLYSDVMLDKPASQFGTTAVDEEYAKFRLADHYRTLGSSLATEYYYSEKRTGGLFLMKNYANPSLVDQFINAGQTIFNDTRNVNVQAQDYIWASLYSDTYRDGNLSAAGAGSGNQSSMQQIEQLFLLGYVNGYVARNGLLYYGTDGSTQYTQWGNGVQYRVSGNALTVTRDGDLVASLNLSGGRIIGDCFVPGYHDDSQRIFAYSSNGGAKTWRIPSFISASAFKLYRLTENGRVFVAELQKTAGQISFNADPGVGYVLDYSSAAVPENARENLALTAQVSASSNEKRASWKEDAKGVPVSSEELYIKKGDLTGKPDDTWQTGDDPLLKDLTSAMLKSGDARYLRYHRYVISGFAADGVKDTYWMPASSDASPVLHFQLPGQRELNSLRLDYDSGNAPGTLQIRMTDENGKVLYSGPAVSGTAYTLQQPALARTINLAITNASGADQMKLQEVSLYGGPAA